MHRVTVALDDELLAEIDRIMAQKGYQSRSETVAIWRAPAFGTGGGLRNLEGLRCRPGLCLRPCPRALSKRL